MNNLYFEKVQNVFFSPEVKFNAQTGLCEMNGESFLENTLQFYKNLLDWLSTYTFEVGGPIDFHFRITYFNTSSARSILDLLALLKEYQDTGKSVVFNWYYEPTNKESMLEDVEDFESESGLKINFLPLV